MKNTTGFTISILSEQEHELVRKAEETYGDFYLQAVDLISFSKSFVTEISNKASWVYLAFLGSISNNLMLVLLSILRKHENQANLILRHVLEATVLACYSLHLPEINSFVKKGKDGEFEDVKSVKDKAYKWFQVNHQEHSIKISFLKRKINERHSHSSLSNSLSRMKIKRDTEEISFDFFDNKNIQYTTEELMGFNAIILDLIKILSDVAKNFEIIVIVPNLNEKITSFLDKNKELFKTLTKKYPDIVLYSSSM